MKKPIAILFLSIFLYANTEIGELFNLPTLVYHYFEHHNDKNDDEYGISFIDFLKNHYNENNQPSENAKLNHQKLPFKSAHCDHINTVIALVQHQVFNSHTSYFISTKNVASYTEQYYTFNSLGNIWQPPKLG